MYIGQIYIGYIVGSAIATAFLVCGIIALVWARKKNKKNKWAIWLIIFGVLALISAVVNYHIFDF